jgi:peptidoglycan/xylan/chitin deacetylase (PgdA/CDA1 family)
MRDHPMKPSRNGPFPYVPIKGRAPLEWPGGAKLALWIVPNIEFFPLDEAMPGPSNERPTGNERLPMVREWAQRDYGNRVGVFRVMEMLERHKMPATVALNSDICDERPQIIAELKRLGWEIMGHNERNTVRLSQVPLEEEAALIRRALDKITAATGTRPVGWLSSGSYETWNTLEHLIDNGIKYVCDWVNDDQPYRMKVGNREIISVPYTADINDVDVYMRQKLSTADFERMICEQFDVLYREGQRVMAISLHPFISGLPHRIGAVDRALSYINKVPGVWKATGREIMEHYSKIAQPR